MFARLGAAHANCVAAIRMCLLLCSALDCPRNSSATPQGGQSVRMAAAAPGYIASNAAPRSTQAKFCCLRVIPFSAVTCRLQAAIPGKDSAANCNKEPGEIRPIPTAWTALDRSVDCACPGAATYHASWTSPEGVMCSTVPTVNPAHRFGDPLGN